MVDTAVGQTMPLDDEDAMDLARPDALSDDDIVALIRIEKSQASSYQNTTITKQRSEALNYYMAEPYGDEQAERSKVVTTEVRDTIESLLPQIVKLFLSSDRVVRYEAQTVAEEEGADQATDLANHVIHSDNDGFMLFYTWFKDALLQKNGIVKVWWDDQVDVCNEIYTGLLEEELLALLQDREVEPVAYSPSEQIEMPAQAPGQPPQPVPLYDVEVRRTKRNGRVRVECVPPEEFLISLKAANIKKARFVAHKTLRTISELIEMGIPKDAVWDLGGETTDGDVTDERYVRFQYDGGNLPDSENVQHALRKVWVSECYYLVDTDGDGIAERWKFLLAGANDKMLMKERWEGDWPFESITPIPMSHKFFGLSIHDLVRDIQRIKSTLTRQFLDNLYQLNNNRMLVQEGLVNFDDLLTNRPGGIVRTSASPSTVAMPLQPQPLGAVVIPAMEYLDSVNEKRTGVTAYNQGLDANSLNKTATGINLINNAAQERMLLVARIFAETGVKGLFSQILRLLVRNQDKPRAIKLRGKWVMMDPSKWNADMAVTVDVALGTSNRMEQMSILSQILAVQKEAILGGAPIASWPKMYNTLAKLIEAAGLKSVETYFDNPETANQAPKGPSPEEIKAKAEIEKTQMQLAHEKELEAFRAEQATKNSVLDLAAKKMDIESRERIASQNAASDMLGFISKTATASSGTTTTSVASGKGGKAKRISVKRNPVTQEIEELIPVYEEAMDRLGGGKRIVIKRNPTTREIDEIVPVVDEPPNEILPGPMPATPPMNQE
jgi:hypothetical protein